MRERKRGKGKRNENEPLYNKPTQQKNQGIQSMDLDLTANLSIIQARDGGPVAGPGPRWEAGRGEDRGWGTG
jgi:hypothetical protein